ncbi:DUF1697 domain-containing protein [Thalassiella azotivora]
MTTYVALLRGINVGTANRVAMADLRRVVADAGGRDVVTYVNSGNVVLEHDEPDDAALGALLEAAVADALGVSPRVLVRSAAELDDVVAANPFPDEPDPKKVHAVFLPGPLEDAAVASAREAQEAAAQRGSRDRVEVVGRVSYLHTPDGLGRSILADLLSRRAGPSAVGTARNWSTVTRLQRLCAERRP